jgi:hypothetical protein
MKEEGKKEGTYLNYNDNFGNEHKPTMVDNLVDITNVDLRQVNFLAQSTSWLRNIIKKRKRVTTIDTQKITLCFHRIFHCLHQVDDFVHVFIF